MNKGILIISCLIFCCCSSTIKHRAGIENIEIHIPTDPQANYIELIGYFQIHYSDQPKDFLCTLYNVEQKETFTGTLLSGGNIFSIQSNDRLKEFLNQNSPIFVKIDSFYGKIERESIPTKNVILQYLPNTIIYDL